MVSENLGAWSSMSTFGEGAGPILFGILTDKFGFRVAIAIMFSAVIAMLSVVLTKLCYNIYAIKMRQSNVPELIPLLRCTTN